MAESSSRSLSGIEVQQKVRPSNGFMKKERVWWMGARASEKKSKYEKKSRRKRERKGQGIVEYRRKKLEKGEGEAIERNHFFIF